MASPRGITASRLTRWRALSVVALAGFCALAVAKEGASKAPVVNSGLDAPLFYQLLIGEMEAAEGRGTQAAEFMLDAARRTRDEALFRRAAEMAVQARAGEQALAIIKAWRSTLPASREAVQLQIQVLFALGKAKESVEPLRTLIASTPPAQRALVLATLPRLFDRAGDAKEALVIIEQVVQPYLDTPDTRTAARIALARAAWASGNSARALDLMRSAQRDEPAAPAPALLAMDMMGSVASAEAIALSHLARPDVEPAVRMAYARALTASQRLNEAAAQLRMVVAQQPANTAAWLGLGAYSIELKQLDEAEGALRRYLALKAQEAAAPAAAPRPADPGAPTDDEANTEPAEDPKGHDPVQAWMMLSQVAEMRGDLRGAQTWLDKIQAADVDLSVTTRRAAVMARQGQIDQARQLIAQSPEREPGDARAKALAESELLREVNQPQQAFGVLEKANERFPDDVSLLYEQAMLAERLDRVDDMELLLRRVIALQPDHAHAHNALGYSLADRNVRLTEARDLIQKALQLSPGDPFIVDSLGWAEYRLGNFDAAITLLRKAFGSRADTEIAAHLGEVLWVSGQRDEARRVWIQAQAKDHDNDVLRQTLQRLKVGSL